MFDINSLAVKDSDTLHLTHPATGELLYADEEKTKPVQIVLWSTSSKAYRAASNAAQNRRLKRKSKEMTAELAREEGVEILVACSQRGENFTYNGEALDNPDAFRRMYSDDKFSWIKEQVDSYVSDLANFIKA